MCRSTWSDLMDIGIRTFQRIIKLVLASLDVERKPQGNVGMFRNMTPLQFVRKSQSL